MFKKNILLLRAKTLAFHTHLWLIHTLVDPIIVFRPSRGVIVELKSVHPSETTRAVGREFTEQYYFVLVSRAVKVGRAGETARALQGDTHLGQAWVVQLHLHW